MKLRYLFLSGLALMSIAWGQGRITDRRTASMRGGGGEGKCTIEVVVDDVADVEIRGPNAVIRTLSGSPATFRRFECNQAMPANPNAFRFEGVDGRGRQDLTQQPYGGAPAVIRIVDSKGGNEGYTFDIFWNGGNGGGGGFGGRGGGFGGGGGGGFGGGFGGNQGGWNNGWGSGSGWGNGGNFNFSGQGNGSFRDQSGRNRRLTLATVFIGQQGNINVSFDGEAGRIELNGRVDSRSNRRVFANVSGGGRSGQMIIEMSAYDRVERITMPTWNLSWNN